MLDFPKRIGTEILNNSLFLLFVSFLLFACKTGKTDTKKTFVKESIFGIERQIPTCFKSISADDARATFACNLDTITYYQNTNFKEPLNLQEQFTHAFYAYHYHKFMEKVMVDQKSQKMMRDSVSIIDARRITPSLNLMFKCDACDAVATLRFKNYDFQFPYTAGENALKENEKTSINWNKERGVSTKTYFRTGSPFLLGKRIEDGDVNRGIHISYYKKNSRSTYEGLLLLFE